MLLLMPYTLYISSQGTVTGSFSSNCSFSILPQWVSPWKPQRLPELPVQHQWLHTEQPLTSGKWVWQRQIFQQVTFGNFYLYQYLLLHCSHLPVCHMWNIFTETTNHFTRWRPIFSDLEVWFSNFKLLHYTSEVMVQWQWRKTTTCKHLISNWVFSLLYMQAWQGVSLEEFEVSLDFVQCSAKNMNKSLTGSSRLGSQMGFFVPKTSHGQDNKMFEIRRGKVEVRRSG